MSDLTNYKCLACGGALKFSSQRQKLVCTYCSADYDVQEFDAAGDWETKAEYKAKKIGWDIQKDGLVAYECKNCGGEIGIRKIGVYKKRTSRHRCR